MKKEEIKKQLNDVNSIQNEEIKFAKILEEEIKTEIANETENLKGFDKEKEMIKNGIMNKIFYALFGRFIKRMAFGCYVKFDDKIIWSYEFPKK